MNKYDLDNLTEQEIAKLIENEKNPENLMNYQDIYNQIVSTLIYESGAYRCNVKDLERNILYEFTVHTTPIQSRFSIGLRFLDVKKHLLRLDFGNTLRHKNNQNKDNEYVVYGSHAHIYSSDNKYEPKNVIPISDLDEFKNLKYIRDVFLEYIRYTNIKERTDRNVTS
ncbi:DUF6978 family protein [Ligilactobacillus apodemi]|uniref:Uncharacterized protein n=1 Tax=Ligilactobacillus apodemi DSM 16634 = JCM 16172 TaxID=1423724 RepID=A0A0R1TYU1_9LACO|nr:hypothetical protein [Ligilactobacillus apodemi]KRL84035.1 hypothetical protein FC32_GL001311 [Ligilactobacillus apodemi DSM 16634 = JCM 16172]